MKKTTGRAVSHVHTTRRRIRLGKNVETDEQIVSALEVAATMEKEFRLWTGPYPGLTLDEAERRYEQMCDEER